MEAIMTSFASVPVGRPMLSALALAAVPLLALAAARKPMMIAPGQVSATSHSFAADRHAAPALPGGCWHVLFVPSHWSSEHGLASAVHPVPAGCFASAGHVALVPVQVSATSHTPPAARQMAPALPTGC